MSLSPISQAAKEECDPSFFRQKKEEVLRLLRENPRIRTKELAENIRISENTMGRIIRKLKDEKQIERVGGSGSSGFYRALEKS